MITICFTSISRCHNLGYIKKFRKKNIDIYLPLTITKCLAYLYAHIATIYIPTYLFMVLTHFHK
jgi:hypothetical protein